MSIMLANQEGIIVRSVNYKESDKMLTIISPQNGKISAIARGARRVKSALGVPTSLFCYSSFVFTQKADRLSVKEAVPIEMFFHLRDDIKKLSLAQYIADITAYLTPEGQECADILRLMLNTLHILSKDAKPYQLIKSAYELKLMELCGFMPVLDNCQKCGGGENLYLCLVGGNIYCENCASKYGQKNIAMPGSVKKAMEYILDLKTVNIFSFSLSDGSLKKLGEITEKYLINQTEHNFKTLDFYKSL